MYYVYILFCADKTMYTGITTDLERRVAEHNSSPKGAKYTKGRRPVKVIYTAKLPDKSSALREEIRIKKMTRKEKLEMVKPEIQKI